MRIGSERRLPPPAGEPSFGGALVGGVLALALVASTVLFAACAGDDSGPTEPPLPARSLRVSVVSPNGPEGAALLDLPAAGVASVEPIDTQLFSRQSGGSLRVLLLRDAPGELAFRLNLEQGTELPEIRLLQVASPLNRLRDLGGYRVESTGE